MENTRSSSGKPGRLFHQYCNELLTTGIFNGVPLILQNTEVRTSRSQVSHEEPGFTSVKVRCFRQFAYFLGQVIHWIDHYFDWNGPNLEWLTLVTLFTFTGTRDEEHPIDEMTFTDQLSFTAAKSAVLAPSHSHATKC